MSVIVTDLCPITEEEFKDLKKVVGEKLIDVKVTDFFTGDLILTFEKHVVKVSMQDSDVYGINVFWWIEKRKSKIMTLNKKDIQDLIELVDEKIKECKESDSAFMRGALGYWRDLKKKLKEELKK